MFAQFIDSRTIYGQTRRLCYRKKSLKSGGSVAIIQTVYVGTYRTYKPSFLIHFQYVTVIIRWHLSITILSSRYLDQSLNAQSIKVYLHAALADTITSGADSSQPSSQTIVQRPILLSRSNMSSQRAIAGTTIIVVLALSNDAPTIAINILLEPVPRITTTYSSTRRPIIASIASY